MVAQHQLIWTEGLALSQHHFQYAEAHRHFQQQITAPPWQWGVIAFAVDESALALGWFTVTRLQLIFPNQRVACFTQSATHTLSLDLRPYETRRIPITLAMVSPTQIKGLSGYPDSASAGAHQIEYIHIADDYDQTRSFEIAVAVPTFMLFTEQNPSYYDQQLTLAVIERSQQNFVLAQDFIPTILRIEASPLLQQWCGLLASACYACSQVCATHAVILKSAATQFWHFHQQGESHPYPIYLAAVHLLGILSETTLSPHLYHYQHAELTPLFTELKTQILQRLQQLQKTRSYHYVAIKQQDMLWCFSQLIIPTWPFAARLRVKAQAAQNTWAHHFAKYTTVAALEDVMHVIDAHSEGLRLHHQTPVDAQIQCYEIELQGALWDRIQMLGNLALYIPLPLQNLELHLDFIPRGEIQDV